MSKAYHRARGGAANALQIVVDVLRSATLRAQDVQARVHVRERGFALLHHLEVVDRFAGVTDRLVGDTDLVVQSLRLALAWMGVQTLFERMDRLG